MLVPLQLDDGSEILLECEGVLISTEAQNKMETGRAVLQPIRALSNQIAEAALAAQPDEFIAEFGVTFSAETGKLTAVLAKASASANLKFTLKWKRAAE
jgi:Trypsin-co-occurring domain 1